MATLNQKYFKTKAGSEVSIRSATAHDALATLNLKRMSIFDEEFQLVSPEEFNLNQETEIKWIESHLNNPYYIAIVAVLDNEVIGLIDFSNGGRQRISHSGDFGMSVDKKRRGLGIGEILLQSLIDWAKTTHKIENINLTAHSDNHAALALYKKLGLVVEGVRKNDLKYGVDKYLDTVLMGRKLSSW